MWNSANWNSEREPGEDYGNTIDPTSILPILDQAGLHWKASNQSITPFDHSQLVQTMNHPLMPGCTIMVHAITENVKSDLHDYKSSFNIHRDHVMKCPDCGGDLVLQKYQDEKQNKINQTNRTTLNIYCDVETCRRVLKTKDENVHFQCVNGKEHHSDNKDKDFCVRCVTDHFSRHRITKMTINHHRYYDYRFNDNKKSDFSIINTLTNAGFEVEQARKAFNYGDATRFTP